jgi:transcription elongation GreA/GreB family factor
MNEKIEIKRALVEKCREILEQNSRNAKYEMEEHQRMANEYGPPKDRYDSFRMQMLRKKDMFAVQYQKALDDLLIIEKIDFTEIKKEVSFGAVVVTDKQKLFISLGLGKILINNETYYAVSPQVPIVKELLGKKEGDKVNFNGSVIIIKSIF